MGIKEHQYLSYLLRLWQVKRNGDVIWRASLDNPHTGERCGFHSLAALMDFLSTQIQEGDDKDQNNLINEETT